MAAGMGWFFFDAQGSPAAVEFDHAVALGVAHGVGKYQRSAGELGGHAQLFGQPGAKENVVAQDQGDWLAIQKFWLNQKGIRQTAWFSLFGIAEL